MKKKEIDLLIQNMLSEIVDLRARVEKIEGYPKINSEGYPMYRANVTIKYNNKIINYCSKMRIVKMPGNGEYFKVLDFPLEGEIVHSSCLSNISCDFEFYYGNIEWCEDKLINYETR